MAGAGITCLWTDALPVAPDPKAGGAGTRPGQSPQMRLRLAALRARYTLGCAPENVTECDRM